MAAERNGSIQWRQLAAVIGCVAGIATIHSMVVVPSILDAAERRTQKLMESHVALTESVRSQYVTRQEIDWLRVELSAINDRLSAIERNLLPK